MSFVIHNENKIVIPFIAVVFLVALGIISTERFMKISFGPIGVISWIVVILGTIYFVLWVLTGIFG